jgi:upstream activation factor subunit UAF30
MEALLEKLVADVKSMHKDIRKIRQSIEDPSGEKAKARSQNNGFRKPLDVDDKLREFLALEAGAKISRAEVTQAIDAYAVKNNLKAGQVINMDDKLRDLLQPPADVQVTYLKLQHYLAPHYIKADKPVVEKSAPVDDKPKKPRVRKA